MRYQTFKQNNKRKPNINVRDEEKTYDTKTECKSLKVLYSLTVTVFRAANYFNVTNEKQIKIS